MGDAYVVVDFDDLPDGTGAKAFAAAVRCIRSNRFDPDFPDIKPTRRTPTSTNRWTFHAEGWWHKPGDIKHVARFLSRHGLSGRLSVEPPPEDGDDWTSKPKPVYKGFSAADPNSRSSKKRAGRRLAIKGGGT